LATADLATLDEIMRADATGWVPHGPPRDGDRWRRTLVADLDGQVVGAATAARHRLHPGRHAFAVQVAPTHRRRGIGRNLVDHLRQVTPDGLPLTAKMLAADPAANGLLGAVGGRVFQSCPSPRPDPTSTAVRDWSAAQPAPAGVSVLSMADLSAAARVDAWVDMYLWVHEAWAPADPDVLREMSPAVVAGTDPALSVYATRDGEPCATAWAIPEPDGTVIVATETTHRDEPDAVSVLAATLAACLRNLAAAGITDVLIDGHDSDPHLVPVIATMPPCPRTPLLLVEVPATTG
jgi:GNAT superfamily N-acetyltransferase